MLKKLYNDIAWIGTPLRIALLLLVTVFAYLAFNSWSVPGLYSLEKLAYDWRLIKDKQYAEQDERIVLVVYTPGTLLTTGQRAPVDRTILAEALRNIDAAQPRAIGIDILFDQPQDDDELLKTAFREMKTPTFLGYASLNDTGVYYEHQEFVDAWFDSLKGVVQPANIRLELDRDGVLRRWPDVTTRELPLMPASLSRLDADAESFADYAGPIRFRAPKDPDQPIFIKIPIDALADPATAQAAAKAIAGRYVLIGGDFSQYDKFKTPFSSVTNGSAANDMMTGLEVQAHMLSQALDGERLEVFIPPVVNVLAVFLSLLMGLFLAGLIRNGWLVTIGFVAIVGAYFALAYGLQVQLGDTRNLGVVGWILALVTGYAVMIAVARTAISQRGETATLALYRYLPPDIAEKIVTQPDTLGLQGETRNVYVMFTDLESFTTLCQSVDAQRLARFLNAYLEAVSTVILKHGGTIDKFVGDAVVAFWGAPVAQPDDAERIMRAAIEIKQVTDSYKGQDIGGDHPVGRTRIGIHYGSAIVGNFGGEGRLQYTALGDTMNVAARLEGANKALGTSILISSDAHDQLDGAIACRPMGRVTIRGRSMPVDAYEPVPDLSQQQFTALNADIETALQGDAQATESLKDWVRDNPDDIAMVKFVERLNERRLPASGA